MPFWGQVGLQSSVSVVGRMVGGFYTVVMLILVLILGLVVTGFIVVLANRRHFSNKWLRHEDLEMWWTLFPVYIVTMMIGPSLHVLYFMEEVNSPGLTVKVVGHQWYWSYEYFDFEHLSFDSYMLSEADLTEGRPFDLLDVDNRMVLPSNTEVRLVITSSDVMHAWTVPSFRVKADAIPGRLNQVGFILGYTGVFYGQCSEICGANHAFMPIVVEVVPRDVFVGMVKEKLDEISGTGSVMLSDEVVSSEGSMISS